MLQSKFKKLNYNLSGGSLTYRHLFTSHHMKLAHFILCIDDYQPALEGTTFSYLFHKKRQKLMNIHMFENNNFVKIIYDVIKSLGKYNNSEILTILYNLYYNNPKLIQQIFETMKNLLLDLQSSKNKEESVENIMKYVENIMNTNKCYINNNNKIVNLKHFSNDKFFEIIYDNLYKDRDNKTNIKYNLKDIKEYDDES